MQAVMDRLTKSLDITKNESSLNILYCAKILYILICENKWVLQEEQAGADLAGGEREPVAVHDGVDRAEGEEGDLHPAPQPGLRLQAATQKYCTGS